MRKTPTCLLGLVLAFTLAQTQQESDHGDGTPMTGNPAAALFRRTVYQTAETDDPENLAAVRAILEKNTDDQSSQSSGRSRLPICASDNWNFTPGHDDLSVLQKAYHDLCDDSTSGLTPLPSSSVSSPSSARSSSSSARSPLSSVRSPLYSAGSPSFSADSPSSSADSPSFFADALPSDPSKRASDWKDLPMNLLKLSHYPDGSERVELMEGMQDNFFYLFKTASNRVVPSTAVQFHFGSIPVGQGTVPKYTCRLAWQNPNDDIYPEPSDPQDHLVDMEPTSLLQRASANPWDKVANNYHKDRLEHLNRSRKVRKTTSVADYRLLTLSGFMRERLPKETDDHLWADGMGAFLQSHDGQFVLAYRVWMYGEQIPRDTGKRLIVVKEKRKGADVNIIEATIRALYFSGQNKLQTRRKKIQNTS